MTILIEKYRFIRDDVFLCPQIDTESGRQKLILRKINLESGQIEFEDSIDCIHTAITNIDIDTFTSIQSNKDANEDFTKNMLEVRSSEKVSVINLKPEEKFKAFKSWAAGITENGMDSLKIQDEIEELAKFQFPIVNFLLRFLLKTEPDGEFLFEYLNKIERECIFEGELHKSSLIANLTPILNILLSNYYSQGSLIELDKELIKTILSIKHSEELFRDNYRYFFLKTQVFPVLIEKLSEGIKSKIQNNQVDENLFTDMVLFLGCIYIEYCDTDEIDKPNQTLFEMIFSSKFITKIIISNPEFLELIPEAKSFTQSELINQFKNESISKGKLNWYKFSSLIKPIISYFWVNAEDLDYLPLLQDEKDFIVIIYNLNPPLLFYENIPEFFAFVYGNIPDFHKHFFPMMKSDCYFNGNKDEEKILKYLRFLNHVWEKYGHLMWEVHDMTGNFFEEILHFDFPFKLFLENPEILSISFFFLGDKEFVELIKKNTFIIEDKIYLQEPLKPIFDEKMNMLLEDSWDWDEASFDIFSSLLDIGLPNDFFLNYHNLIENIFHQIYDEFDNCDDCDTSNPKIVKYLKLLHQFRLPVSVFEKKPEFIRPIFFQYPELLLGLIEEYQKSRKDEDTPYGEDLSLYEAILNGILYKYNIYFEANALPSLNLLENKIVKKMFSLEVPSELFISIHPKFIFIPDISNISEFFKEIKRKYEMKEISLGKLLYTYLDPIKENLSEICRYQHFEDDFYQKQESIIDLIDSFKIKWLT